MKEQDFENAKKLTANVQYLGKVELLPVVNKYELLGNIAIELLEWDDDEMFWDDFATLTINPGMWLNENEAAIDTNNCPWGEDFIKSNGIGEPTGEVVMSGFCSYPVYRFKKEFLDLYRWEDDK